MLSKQKMSSSNQTDLFSFRNNRITTEGAVMLGKGLAVNDSLKVLRVCFCDVMAAFVS